MSSPGVSSDVLADALQKHRSAIVRQMDSGTVFLTVLAKHRLIQPGDILKYERNTDRELRNVDLLDIIGQSHDDAKGGEAAYSKFMDALKRTGQHQLVAVLTNVRQELDIVEEYQTKLSERLGDIDDFLKTETRRTEVFSPANPDESDSGESDAIRNPEEGEKENPAPHASSFSQKSQNEALTTLLLDVHQSTEATLSYFDRCKEVIQKLHQDCDGVARKNADMLSSLRECEQMVQSAIPSHAKSEAFDKDKAAEVNDDTASVRSALTNASQVSRTLSRRNETQILLLSFQHNLGIVRGCLDDTEVDNTLCCGALDSMIKDVRERRRIMDKHSEPPPRDGKPNKYTGDIPSEETANCQMNAKPISLVLSKLKELAVELQLYVHHESQLTHRFNINAYRNDDAASSSHRNFDQIEHDFRHLLKEVRRNDTEHAMALVKQIVEATKSEREACVMMVDDIERKIRVRRQRLQEGASGARHLRKRVTTRKMKAAKAVESNFSKRLYDLNKEVVLCMDLESDKDVRTKENMAKVKLKHEEEVKAREKDIRSLQRRVLEVEIEREKFKIMYQQEKEAAKHETKTTLLTKPIIPRRDARLPPTQKPTRAFRATATSHPLNAARRYKPPAVRPSGNVHTSTYLTELDSSAGEVSTSRAGAMPLRRHQYSNRNPWAHGGRLLLANKPRLTPRARNLTTLHYPAPPGAKRRFVKDTKTALVDKSDYTRKM